MNKSIIKKLLKISTISLLIISQNILAKKNLLTFSKGDLTTRFNGKIEKEYYKYINNYYFNNLTPDNFSYNRFIINLYNRTYYGEKKYGHKAIETYLYLRSKSKEGLPGNYQRTDRHTTYLDDISLGTHYHGSLDSIPWVQRLWLRLSLNAITNSKSKNLNFVKLGRVSNRLGNGISLSNYYVNIYEYAGGYNYYSDTGTPGIIVEGELIKDRLWYDLFYTIFEEKGSRIEDTYDNIVRQRLIGERETPYRGENQDDEVWSARLNISPLKKGHKLGILNLLPYIYYNRAKDQLVTYADSAQGKFGAYGFEAKYKKNKIEINSEIAFNYGKEEIFAVDKNIPNISTLNDSSTIPKSISDIINETNSAAGAGLLYKNYNNVYLAGTTTEAPMNDATNELVYQAENITKDSTTTYPDTGINANKLINSSSRIRDSYTNLLRGWFGLVNATYKSSKNISFSTEYAYSSGGDYPYSSGNKTYKGFLGNHENFQGSKVKLPLVLERRYVPRIFNLTPGTTESNIDARQNRDFSDIQYLGFSSAWYPKIIKNKKLKINPNVSFLWKAQKTYKYIYNEEDPDSSYVSNNFASTFLGTEINLKTNYEILKDLKLIGSFSIFAPGSFFKDIKGVPYYNDYYLTKIPSNATSGVDRRHYRINTKNAIYIRLTLQYNF